MGVGIGLIGCGVMGRVLAKLVEDRSPELRVTALFDPDDRSCQATQSVFPDARRLPDVGQLVGDPTVDWVMIASWNRHHAAQCLAALSAGKHVFCQKPLATRMEDLVALARARAGSDRSLVIGFTLRFAEHYRRIRALVEQGAIGRLVSLELNETLDFNHGGYIMGDWRRLRANAGTHLLEKCCHDVDLLHWISGSRPRRVASFGGLAVFTPENEPLMDRLGRDVEGRQAYRTWGGLVAKNPFTADKDIVDHQVAILELESGARATFHTNCNAGLPERRMLLLGTEGALRADLHSGVIELGRIGFESEVERHDAPASDRHGGGDLVLAESLAACMLGAPAPRPGFEEGLDATVSCLAIDRALDTGKVVDLTPWWREVEEAGASRPR